MDESDISKELVSDDKCVQNTLSNGEDKNNEDDVINVGRHDENGLSARRKNVKVS